MAQRDPYILDGSLVEDPPTTWSGRIRMLGPGFVLTASIVGSGELIATTALGARAGYYAMWLILLSCVVKVALQLEFGRHTIQTGETCLAAFNKIPGPAWAGANWTVWFWLLLQPLKILQVGGIVGGVALLMHMVLPIPDVTIGGTTYGVSIPAWCWITAVVTAVLVSGEGYRFIEKACVLMIVAFTATTLVSVLSLQWTDYAVSSSDLINGLRFRLPEDKAALVLLIGAFGLTGVGGDEIMQYTYWLIEKGYAAKTGPRDPNDPRWAERARGWTRIMYLDALASMVVYTTVTVAFYILGAAVLHARGDLPKGDAMIETLAYMYTESLGQWAKWVFLLGAFVVLYSTVFSALAAWTRVFADAGGIFGMYDFHDLAARRKAIVCIAWFFPLAWATIYLVVGEPVYMVTIGGIATAAILFVVVVGAIHFRYGRTAPEMRPSWLYDAALWLSIAAIAIAIYGAVDKIAKSQTGG